MTTTTNDLRDRIIAIEGHVLEIEGERSELSYAAMFEGCARSAKRVAEINTELARLANETAVLHAAIAEAGKRDAVAAATKRDAEERANAEKALALLDDFARDGAKLEDAANALVEKFNSLCLKSRQLTALGYPPATPALVDVNMATALKTKLMSTGLQIEHIAPGARRTFGGIIASWTDNVRARASARLNRNTNAAKDAA